MIRTESSTTATAATGHELLVDVDGRRLDYDNLVVATPGGCTVRFTAELQGPAAAVLERLVAPLSAFGQRRRITRLIRLAEFVEGKRRVS